MHIDTTEQLEPCVVRIQRMLRKIDQLHLPPASRRDLENILVIVRGHRPEPSTGENPCCIIG